MPTTYTIYLQNESADTQVFWCFLSRPDALKGSEVFANSAVSIAIDSNDPSTNFFGIPARYVVGVGASNNSVDLNVSVTSNMTLEALPGQSFEATYYNAPPSKGPKIIPKDKNNLNSINIVTNNFNKVDNETAGWYSNQSFGIQTDSGFMGMTWSPGPGITRIITPKLQFYISVGNFGANSLAEWNHISNNSAEVSIRDFTRNNCTVTYTQSGTWSISGGVPRSLLAARAAMGYYSSLTDQALLGEGQQQEDTLLTVRFDNDMPSESLVDDTFLTGEITVVTALLAAFTFFVLAGIRFSLSRATPGSTKVAFSYSGDRSAESVRKLFVAGAKLKFGNG